ncbi:MAG: iron-sulfur cluster assembly accessory protein [Halobacteriovorax sp.]|nr:iron-sulfur cluster assembly accessory protein [Halobacteriovorax sp.]|tara:strand:+ start:2098 stop:2466 length:369 start_codon:yes stop_codon:yes gene_type:complete
MDLKITEVALAKALELKKKMNKPDDYVLQVGLRGGGCSGFKYELDFISPPENEDIYRIFDHGSLKIYCDRKSFIFLNGTEIGYEETILSSGFTFNTPYASKSCGCGESISFDPGRIKDESPK